MGAEIERKFLVANDAWRSAVEGQARIRQGYLTQGSAVTVRVRVKGERAYLTIKGPTRGIRREELEYPIPVVDAETMLRDLVVPPVIDKTRYRVRCGDHLWELDVFAGANAGLVLAEIELGHEDEHFTLPPWAGPEVSHDPRYFNANLARHPYGDW